jgi:hypothetical protein
MPECMTDRIIRSAPIVQSKTAPENYEWPVPINHSKKSGVTARGFAQGARISVTASMRGPCVFNMVTVSYRQSRATYRSR